MSDTTGELTSEEVSQREHLFYGLIAAAVAVVFFVALAAAYARSFRQISDAEVLRALEGNEEQTPLASGDNGDSGASAAAPSGSPENKEVEMAQKEQAGRLETNGGFVRKRNVALAVLFVVYVSSCVAVPLAGRDTLSCKQGFFWERHMVFLFVFVVTKLAEVYLYNFDPTLTGSLPIFMSEKGFPFGILDGFCWKFVMSFLGFADGYQDMASILVALSCPEELSQKLGTYMLACYIVGVVGAQWLLMSILAFRDPSKACFAKLLHMDTFAAKITLPTDQQRTWRMIHAARTFGEDLPQALLQSLYLVYVKENPLMLVSVCMAVGGSVLALKDAITRKLLAQGFKGGGVKSVYVCWGWAIHGVVFVGTNNELTGNLLANDGVEMDIAANWRDRDGSHGDKHCLQLQPGEHLVQVSGVNNTSGYLCQELTFRTSQGQRKTFDAGHSEWRGDLFDFVAPDGHAIVGLHLAGGRCSGIETVRV